MVDPLDRSPLRAGPPTTLSFDELRRQAVSEGRTEDASEFGHLMQLLQDRSLVGWGISGLLRAALLAPILSLPFWIFRFW